MFSLGSTSSPSSLNIKREREANRKNIIIFAIKNVKKMHKVCPDILLATNALLLNSKFIVNAEQH